MKKLFCILSLFAFLILSCHQKRQFTFYHEEIVNGFKCKIDTIPLSIASFSGEGFFRVIDSTICFFDDLFGLLSIYDSKGNFIGRKLGLGSEKDKIEDFYSFTRLPTKKNVFFSVEYFINTYDTTWTFQGKHISFKWINRKRKPYKTTDLSDINMYDFSYDDCPTDTRWIPATSKGILVIPINITHRINKECNRFENPINYYKQSYTVGLLNPQTGYLQTGFASHPSTYINDPFLTCYDYNYRDIRNDSFFVSYMADPNIYVYSADLVPAYAFGKEGIGMDKNYKHVKNNKEYSDLSISAKTDAGYYTHIFADKNSDIIFRSYIKGKNKPSGLQVYKGKVLMADIETPRRFNIIGKIGATYYADGYIDDTSQKLGIYTLTINL